ncbi:MAG TPA: hypothetical protein PK048_03555 [Candidatus Absconditabacterales bacterium]|nr:hypothetical protein [Candidatus Absconditabacterales bacterium]
MNTITPGVYNTGNTLSGWVKISLIAILTMIEGGVKNTKNPKYYLSHQGKNIHTINDRQTNEIINLLSGTMTQDQRRSFTYSINQSSLSQLSIKNIQNTDSSLWYTLRSLENKLHNPLIRIHTINRDNADTSNSFIGYHNPFLNNITLYNGSNIIHDLKLSLSSDDNSTLYLSGSGQYIDKRKQRLLNTLISEMSHQYLIQKIGIASYSTRRMKDICTNARKINYGVYSNNEGNRVNIKINRNYHNLYTNHNSMERYTHTIIESQLIQEFIDEYIHYAQGTNQALNISNRYGGFFKEYHDFTKAKESLIHINEHNNGYINYLLGILSEQGFKSSLQPYILSTNQVTYLGPPFRILHEPALYLLDTALDYYYESYIQGYNDAGLAFLKTYNLRNTIKNQHNSYEECYYTIINSYIDQIIQQNTLQ